MSFLSKLKSTLSPSPTKKKSPSSSSTPGPPPLQPPALPSPLKRRNSLSSSMALFRTSTRPGLFNEPQQPSKGGESELDRSSLPQIDLPRDVGRRKDELGLIGEEKDKEDRVLRELRFGSEESQELVGLLTRKLKVVGMGTPNLYSPNSSFPFETQPKPRAFLLSFLRLRRPTLLQPISTSSDLALPPPSPAYLFEQELRFFDDALQLAQMILFVLRRMERAASRERWYASYAAAERAEGYPLTAWTNMGKEGEEKRLLSVVGQMGLEVGAWSLEIGQGLAEWCMLVGWWVLSSDAGGGVEEVMRSWEEKGRKLEHLVLASVRDESTRSKLPTRLLPLIEGYPYAPAASFSSAGHSRSSSQLSLTLPTGGPLSNLPGDPSTSTTKRILHVSISPPSGKKGSLREGFRVDPERLAGWAVGANEDTERGSLATQVWKELLSSARSTSLTDNTIAKDVHLDDLFSDKTLDLIRFISSLFPSTPPIPIAQEPKEEKPIYRPFPKSTSSFLDREGLVESADDNVLLGPVIHDGQSTIRPGHRRQRSKSHSVGTTVPKSFLSETTTVDVFGGSGVEESKTADSTWADFSSFGFDAPSSSSTPHLALGSGLNIDPSKGGKGLNAKERELERLLRGDFGDETKVVSVRGGSNVDLALQGQTETKETGTKETGTKEEEARAELKSVSILKTDSTFFDFIHYLLLDPHSLPATFPTFAVYELKPSLLTSTTSPEWLLVSIAAAPPPKAAPLIISRTPVEYVRPPEKKDRRISGLGSIFRKPSMRKQPSSTSTSTSRSHTVGSARRGRPVELPPSFLGEFGSGRDAREGSTISRRSSQFGSLSMGSFADDLGESPVLPTETGGFPAPLRTSVVDIGRTEENVPSTLSPDGPTVGLPRTVRESAPSPEVVLWTPPQVLPSTKEEATSDEPSMLADLSLSADAAGKLPATTPQEETKDAPLSVPEAVVAEAFLAPSSTTPEDSVTASQPTLLESISNAIEAVVDKAEDALEQLEKKVDDLVIGDENATVPTTIQLDKDANLIEPSIAHLANGHATSFPPATTSKGVAALVPSSNAPQGIPRDDSTTLPAGFL